MEHFSHTFRFYPNVILQVLKFSGLREFLWEYFKPAVSFCEVEALESSEGSAAVDPETREKVLYEPFFFIFGDQSAAAETFLRQQSYGSTKHCADP